QLVDRRPLPVLVAAADRGFDDVAPRPLERDGLVEIGGGEQVRERAEQPLAVLGLERGLASLELGAGRTLGLRGGEVERDDLAARIVLLLQPVGIDLPGLAVVGVVEDRLLEGRVGHAAGVYVSSRACVEASSSTSSVKYARQNR